MSNDPQRARSRAALRSDPIDLARDNWSRSGWEEASDPMGVVTSVMRVHQLLLAEVERVLRPLQLTFARYEVLMLLHFSRAGQLPVGKIGARLQVHPASVTNAVDRLETDGLVERSPHPEDGRSVMATITPAGRELALLATANLNTEVFEKLPMSKSAQGELLRDLQEIRRSFGDFS
jgi:DNA-binding MarR family transcriptional regulator